MSSLQRIRLRRFCRAFTFLKLAAVALFAAGMIIPAGCQTEDVEPVYQGYIEARLTYISSSQSGALNRLAVKRGDRIATGDLLFTLENTVEKTVLSEAVENLNQAKDRLADLRKGRRPSEIQAIEAELTQARTALTLAQKEYDRRSALFKVKGVSRESLDQSESAYQKARAQVGLIQANLTTARQGARPDEISQAVDRIESLKAALERARWALEQKEQRAPVSGTVFDTFFSQGERVGPDQPVLAILAPENLKVRFFVPESDVAKLKTGQQINFSCDGCPSKLQAVIDYIRPEVEYTPPVIYSNQTRSRLVVMVEGAPRAGAVRHIHPGLPVDVTIE